MESDQAKNSSAPQVTNLEPPPKKNHRRELILVIILVVMGLLILLLFRRHLNQTSPTNGVPATPLASTNPSAASSSPAYTGSGKLPAHLKGFVTITNYTNGTPQNYTVADYQKMASYQANYQSIRIGAKAMGGAPGYSTDASYLSRLDQMVKNASSVGMYSEFKMTMYDLPGFVGGSKAQSWGDFWRDKNGQQEALIAAWQKLWNQEKNQSMVVGYDLLNEPEEGNLNISNDQFVRQYLGPFYQKAIDSLHATDSQKLAFFQPPLATSGYQPFNFALNRQGLVYAPHFYPNLGVYLRSFSSNSAINISSMTTDYDSTMNRYLSEGQNNQAPVVIGEYGMPWDPQNDGNTVKQQAYADLEKTTLQLFAQHNLSYSRPWYADDRAESNLGFVTLDWALIEGSSGLDGPPRSFILDVFKSY